MAEPAMTPTLDVRLELITEANAPAAARFLTSMPEADRTFFMEAVDDETPQRWGRDPVARRWLASTDGRTPIAYLGIVPGTGWSAHVGSLRLIVAPGWRRRGIGALLARRGLLEGMGMGLRKLTVGVVADREGDIEMFTAIGFTPEAVLRDHFRRADGEVHDLVLLSHMVDEAGGDLALLGVDRAVGLGEEP